MPRKAEYERVRKRMAEDPEFAEHYKAQKAAQDQRRYRSGKKKPGKKSKEQVRKIQLKKLGWTPETFEKAKHDQNNRCAICREEKPLVADHKHIVPPVPRAALCNNCNALLGFAQEKLEILGAAIQYLKKWN